MVPDYIEPPLNDSDLEVDDLGDLSADDDDLDPDYLLNLPDDLIPTASGKNCYFHSVH